MTATGEVHDGALPDEAYAAALTTLPGCGPARLAAAATVTSRTSSSFADVWAAIVADRSAVVGDARLAAVWTMAARRADVAALWGDLGAHDVRVLVRGRGAYPAALVDDPEPPIVLFTTGSVGAVDAIDGASSRVAIVGTRRCTGYGADVARALGRGLTAAGVAIVSGLAAGIDAAAHEGALAAHLAAGAERHGSGSGSGSRLAPPIGVVGSGLDVVYPRRNRRLWRDVAAAGVLLSEAPLGAPPEPWRFPLRNRIIAALADVVVVVESHERGGSMHTVQAAVDRDVPVMAVPGSVRSPSSVGTNRLISDGVPPVLDVDDVLVALSLRSRPGASLPSRAGASHLQEHPHAHPRPQLDPVAAAVLDALDWEPTTTEDVLRRTSITLGPVAAALNRLEMAGLARSRSGTWERTGNHE